MAVLQPALSWDFLHHVIESLFRASHTNEKAPPEHTSYQLPQQAPGEHFAIQHPVRLASRSCPLSGALQAEVSQSRIYNIFGVTNLQGGTCTRITHAPVVAEDMSSSESALSVSTWSSSSSTSAASLAASVASTSSTVSDAVMEALPSLLSGPFLFPDRSPAFDRQVSGTSLQQTAASNSPAHILARPHPLLCRRHACSPAQPAQQPTFLS